MNKYQIAQVCHEANRGYCRTLGDFSQLSWESCPQWQRDSAINGVQFHMDNPDAYPEASHNNWFEEKAADGWEYGEVKDPDNKLHPCMVAFEDLPEEQQIKDVLFKGIVDTLRADG